MRLSSARYHLPLTLKYSGKIEVAWKPFGAALARGALTSTAFDASVNLASVKSGCIYFAN